MPMITCVGCGTSVQGARQRRFCDRCRLARDTREVRTLSKGERVPDGIPGRYVRSHGYVLLRWKVGVKQYVETYEHRVFDGRVTTEDEVHHVNRVRTDNRPENLRPTTSEDHRLEHAAIGWWAQAARLYSGGMSTQQVGKKLSRDPGNVYRALVSMGVPIRKDRRIAIPKREQRQTD